MEARLNNPFLTAASAMGGQPAGAPAQAPMAPPMAPPMMPQHAQVMPAPVPVAAPPAPMAAPMAAPTPAGIHPAHMAIAQMLARIPPERLAMLMQRFQQPQAPMM